MKYLKLFENYDSEDITPQEVYSKLEQNCKPFLDMLRVSYNEDEKKYYDFKEEHQLHMFLGKECPVLYRGASNSWQDYDIKSVEVRKDRRSKDTNQVISDEIDSSLNDAFGIKPRKEGAFVTPKRRTAEHYGYPYMFFPIGDFDYIWSDDIRDLFDELRNPPNKMYSWYLWEIESYYREQTIRSEVNSRFELRDRKEDYYDIVDDKSTNQKGVDDFKEKFEEEMDVLMMKQKQEFMDSLPNRYKFNKEFEESLSSDGEIVFICDDYYLVKTGQPASKFEEELLKLIYNLDI